jgi:hypothetical protein
MFILILSLALVTKIYVPLDAPLLVKGYKFRPMLGAQGL